MTDLSQYPPVKGGVGENLITPGYVFSRLDEEFNFELDVCASESNAKCEKYFSLTEDGLVQSWEGVCWCHPPYGKAMRRWVRKAYIESSRAGTVVVCLLPARTDTVYWHEYVMKAAEVRLVKGRIKFEGQWSSAPFPSAIVIFDDSNMVTKFSSIIF